jgi:paraquat-inducible protein B
MSDVPSSPVKLQRRRFSAIWLVPIVAALIAAYLGASNFIARGPVISITFKSAEGLVADQTQIKYKGVPIGTVESIKLSPDKSLVVVNARMNASAKSLLNPKTRFWVVKLEFDSFNASDLESLVSGSYIQIDPGADQDDKKEEHHFTGLESPPADRTGQPGQTFVLKSVKVGALHIGAPVYYRDAVVGEILKYDLGNGFEPVTITVLIYSPYDQYVREKTRFWNVSGVSMTFGANGLHLETHSLRAVLLGGLAFETPPEAQGDAVAPAKSVFTLYDNQQEALSSTFASHRSYVTYFQTSIKDLAPGSPVMIYGLSVGQVTSVKLIYDPQTNTPKVRVDFEVDPEKAFGPNEPGQSANAVQILRQLVEKGVRVKLDSSNLLIGQKILTLEFTPDAAAASLAQEGDITVVPSTGSADNIMDAVADIANKLNQIPFDQIGQNLNHLIGNADKMIAGPEIRKTMHDLSTAMANAADLSQKANVNMTPALQRLPDISAQLQSAVAQANQLFSGLQSTYGTGSDFNDSAKRTLDQVNDAARSIRLLADYLERHPEALLSGKSYEKDKTTEKDKP